MTRQFAHIEQGLVVEIVPPLPLDAGWLEIMPEDGDVRIYYGYAPESWAEITDLDPSPQQGWTADMVDGAWVLSPYVEPPIPPEQLALIARQERDRLLKFYDAGINMALRAQRMATTDPQKEYAASKISELDIYAEALLAIPDQPGFPQTVDWPVAPTK